MGGVQSIGVQLAPHCMHIIVHGMLHIVKAS
jgi:ssRNA-specific RNase YbeY (16S rRNA maturation enzyme)